MVLVNSSHVVKQRPACQKGRKLRARSDSSVELPVIRRRRRSRDQDLKLAMANLKRGIPEKIVKQGSLFVQSRGLWRLPASFWKERYFILNNDCLYFFKRGKDLETSQSPKEIIFLDFDLGIYTEEISTVNGRKNFCLKLTKRRRSYTLCACSEEERNSWLTALLTVVTENHLSQSSFSNVSPIPEESSFDGSLLRGKSEWNLTSGNSPREADDSLWKDRRASNAEFISTSNGKNNNERQGKLFKAFSMLNLGSHSEHRKSCVLFV